MDQTYSPDDLLPMSGASGLLLCAAVSRSGMSESLSELGRTVGISKFAASRAAQPLRQAGLLVESSGGWLFEENHPMAPLVRRAAWLLGGVADIRRIGSGNGMQAVARSAFGGFVTSAADDAAIRDALLNRGLGPAAGTTGTLLQGRLLVIELLELEAEARAIFDWVGGIYGQVTPDRERARDYVRLFDRLGAYLRGALRELWRGRVAASIGEVDLRDPRTTVLAEELDGPHSDRRCWGLAIVLLDAEADKVNDLAVLLRTASEQSDALKGHMTRAYDAIEHARDIDAAFEHLDQAQELWDSKMELRTAKVGGTPSWHDFTAGGLADDLVAARLEAFRARLVECMERAISTAG